MKQLSIFLAILLLLVVTIFAIRESNYSKLETRRIEVQLDQNQKKIEELESRNSENEQQVKEANKKRRLLEEENKKLEAQRRAKAELKRRDAKVYAAEAEKPSIGRVQSIIVAAANKYGVDANRMLRIAKCESTFNPSIEAPNVIDGGHPSGLFQHVSTYWPARAKRYGWKGASVFNAQANAEVTAQMFKENLWHLWECK